MKQAAVKISHSTLALLLFSSLLLSALSALTFAWQDFTQHATNQFKASLYEVGSVVLTKYETGKDGENGTPDVRVAGAEFLLYRIHEDATEIQVGAQFTTNAEGQLVAHSLPAGNYVFVETAPPYGYDFALDENDQPITRYPFSIGEGEVWHLAIKAYNRALAQSLTVTKTLQNASGRPIIEDQLAMEFVFTIHFSDGSSYDCSVAGAAPVSIPSGGSFTLRHEEKAIFVGIPVGVQYTISEEPLEDFCTTSENSQGHITKDGAEAHFLNTYQDVGGAIFIRKTIGGELANPEDDFHFTVTFEDGGTYYYVVDDGPAQSLASGGTLTLKGNQTATFGKLPLGLQFTVEETGMPPAYQPTVHTVTGQATQVGSEALFYNILQEESEDPGSLAITKALSGSLAEPGKEFAFTVSFSDGGSYEYTLDGAAYPFTSGETILLKGGQTAIFENLPKGLGYLVEELPSDYLQSMQKTEGVIVAKQTATLPFINEKNPEPEHIDPILRVRKQVDGPSTDKEFEFTVKIDDEANDIHTVDTFMLKHGETRDFHCFSGARYEVTEKNYFDDGYIETTTHASGVLIGDETTVVEAVITNTWYRPEMLMLSGTKAWDLSANPGAILPPFITVLLKNGDLVVESKQVYPDSEGNWNYSFEVPKYAPNGDEIHYTLVEEPCAGFWPEVKQEEGNLNLVNHAYALLAVDFLDVKKSISGEEIPAGDSFAFTLTGLENAPMPEGSVEGVKKIIITGQGTGDFGAIQFNHPGSYSYQVREVSGLLAGYTYDGANYNVTIVIKDTGGALGVAEVLVAKDGTAMTPLPTEMEFVNTYVQPPSRLIGISVRKIVIQSPTNPHPNFAKVQLYQNGTPVGDIVLLNDGNNWQHTWQNLDPEGVWTVDEIDVPTGYSKEITGSPEEGFIITDRFDPYYEKIVVAGEKTWSHGSNPPENQPTEIVVRVKNGDYVVAQKRVTAAENWQWQFELPKIDSDGKEIQYTLEEEPVTGYNSKIDGWNITNTYTGSGGKEVLPGGKSPTGNSPQTNDPIKLWLWVGIFAGTAVALASLFLYSRHKRIQKKTREIQAKLVYRRKK